MSDFANPIPTYGLFGENALAASAGFGHIETIAERSRLHDWEISPHRHAHSIQVLIIEQGEARVTVDGAATTLLPPAFIILPAASVHGFRFQPDTRGIVLTLSQDFLGRCAGQHDPLRALLSQGGNGRLDPAASARIAALSREMLALAQPWQTHDLLFQALAEALLRSLARSLLLSLPDAADASPETLDDRRLAQFRQLLEQHLAQHHSLGFYANSMGCTQRTLTRLTQARMGASPLALIHRRLALEAQRLLRYTNASVAQVAHELGFADPSYFSRFYLRLTGKRPQAERDAI